MRGIIYAEGKAPYWWSAVYLPTDKVHYPGRPPFAFAAPEGMGLQWEHPRGNQWEMIERSAIFGNSIGSDLGGLWQVIMYFFDYRTYINGHGFGAVYPIRNTRWVDPGHRYVDVQLRYKPNNFADLFFRHETIPFGHTCDLILPRALGETTLSRILDEIEEHHSGRYDGFIVIAGRGTYWS